MAKSIFINLPVFDLDRSKEFFAALGFTFNAQFTNHEGACMVVSETIYVMLLTRSRFQDFTPKEISDATTTTEVLVCLSCDSRQEVMDLVTKALAAGGSPCNEPQDHGFMYGHGFQDPDGHIWELVYMDPSFVQPT